MKKNQKNTTRKKTLSAGNTGLRILRGAIAAVLFVALIVSTCASLAGIVLSKTIGNKDFYSGIAATNEMSQLVEEALDDTFLTEYNETGIPEEHLKSGYDSTLIQESLKKYAESVHKFFTDGGKFHPVTIDEKPFEADIDVYVESFLRENGIEPTDELLEEIGREAGYCAGYVQNAVNIFDFSLIESTTFNKLISLSNRLIDFAMPAAILSAILFCAIAMLFLPHRPLSGLLTACAPVWLAAVCAYILSANILRIDLTTYMPFVSGSPMKLFADSLTGGLQNTFASVSGSFFVICTSVLAVIILLYAVFGFSIKKKNLI